LESSLLTQEHVEAGRLIAPVADDERASVSYWLLPLRPGARRPIRIAYEWLLSNDAVEGPRAFAERGNSSQRYGYDEASAFWPACNPGPAFGCLRCLTGYWWPEI
jgi:hypothetical protein